MSTTPTPSAPDAGFELRRRTWIAGPFTIGLALLTLVTAPLPLGWVELDGEAELLGITPFVSGFVLFLWLIAIVTCRLHTPRRVTFDGRELVYEGRRTQRFDLESMRFERRVGYTVLGMRVVSSLQLRVPKPGYDEVDTSTLLAQLRSSRVIQLGGLALGTRDEFDRALRILLAHLDEARARRKAARSAAGAARHAAC